MGRHGEITVDWADGEHSFRLGIGQLRELQEKTDAGPAFLLQRLSDATWRVDDVRETIRLGLIGHGMEPVAALKLVRVYIDERPLIESIPVARAILLAALLGAEDEPVGKRRRRRKASNGASSPSPPSTEPEAPSDSLQTSSTA